MKTCILFVCTLLVSLHGLSQMPNWVWSTSGGGGDLDHGCSISTDQAGNVIVVGGYQSASATFGNFTLSPGTQDNMFIAKYDANGKLLWIQDVAFDDIWAQEFRHSTDAAGNIYVCGYFYKSPVTFGGIIVTKSSSSPMAGFVAKYSPKGKALWVRKIESDSYVSAGYCAVDGSGNLLVSGGFIGDTIFFDQAVFLKNYQSSTHDGFVVKYDPAGNVLWANQIGGPGNEWSGPLAVDLLGNCYFSGPFSSSTISYGTSTLQNSSVYNNLYVAKIDPNGNAKWAIQSSSKGSGYGPWPTALIANAGSVFFSGWFNDSAIVFGKDTLVNAGPTLSEDFFLTKYDTNGNELWAISEGDSSGSDYSTGMTFDSQGKILLCGNFTSNSLTIGNTTMNNVSPSLDLFLAQYDTTNGAAQWVKHTGGTFRDSVSCITTDLLGNIYISGTFYSDTLPFGSQNVTLPAGHFWGDVFVAKLSFPTGYEEIFTEQGISISPNPATAFIQVNLKEKVDGCSLTIYDQTGQEVIRSIISNEKTDVDIRALANGIYFLRVNEEDGIRAIKFIKD